MARNYQKEMSWRKEKYTRIEGFVNKELGDNFKSKLKKEKRTMASWISENIEKYLSE